MALLQNLPYFMRYKKMSIPDYRQEEEKTEKSPHRLQIHMQRSIIRCAKRPSCYPEPSLFQTSLEVIFWAKCSGQVRAALRNQALSLLTMGLLRHQKQTVTYSNAY